MRRVRKQPWNMWRIAAWTLASAALMRVGVKWMADRERNAPTTMIDWQTALDTAQRMLPPAGPQVDFGYQELADTVAPAVSQLMGITIPDTALQVRAVTQYEWLTANVRSFARMMAPLEPFWDAQHDDSDWGLAGRRLNGHVAGLQSGALLSWMAQRVLGQYDVAIMHDGDAPNELLLVESNVTRIARELAVNVDAMREWIVIHEVSHVYQFEGIAWLKPKLRTLMDAFMQTIATQLHDENAGFGMMLRRAVAQGGKGNWLDWALNDTQRAMFAEIQVLMSLIEGHSNYVMNTVGAQRIPQFKRLHQRMESRQQDRPTLDNLIMKATGMQVKMAQYRDGERFVQALAGAGGPELVAWMWRSEAHLPTREELDDPQRWITRYAASASATTV